MVKKLDVITEQMIQNLNLTFKNFLGYFRIAPVDIDDLDFAIYLKKDTAEEDYIFGIFSKTNKKNKIWSFITIVDIPGDYDTQPDTDVVESKKTFNSLSQCVTYILSDIVSKQLYECWLSANEEARELE